MSKDYSDGRWEFYDSWAAFPLNKVQETDSRIIGEFNIGLSAPDGGTYGEVSIRFYEFHRHERWREPHVTARLEAFGDSWQVIASNPALIDALAYLGSGTQGPDEVRTALLSIGMEDRTARLRGTHPSRCPTCHGKGVLDDVAPASLPQDEGADQP